MTLNWQHHPWAGVFPATLCPFHEDESIDETGLHQYMQELASVPGIKGVVCNGHTGEIMSLRLHERQRVTQITAEAVGDQVKVVSGVSAEGSLPAIDDALAAKEVGADAILLMPAHHWLRFGRTPETAVGYFQDVAEGADMPIIVHQYPAWTKAGYSLEEMLEMVAPTSSAQPERVLKPQLSLEDKTTETEKPKEPDAVEANNMLEKALQDRAQDKKEKDGNVKQTQMKKPAASKKSAKKPSAKSTPAPMAVPKPAAKPKAQMKRPAAAPKNASKKKNKKNFGPVPSWDARLHMQPHGCSQCRWVPGCCRSCWIYRGCW